MKKTLIAATIAATMLLTACGGDGRLSVQESCKLLNSDQFKPTGNQIEQTKQIADHYADMATKVDPSIGTVIQGMADLQKKVAESTTGMATAQQRQQFTDAMNNIGKVCGN
ncbi:hypothetical protein RBS60_19145 [Sinomonas sp. ASV486]|uniref:Lipoprotein n=1 Tax=Sinomonas puerhi TaxID=3238584 RepID=A0AB39L4Q0_9MICC|nr:hypothetical protein [Sinomonas sp. ASV486]MDQ4492319.1 hypothetical protein [Sinomonas sp. ASV486]